jgi:hypothetical protein
MNLDPTGLTNLSEESATMDIQSILMRQLSSRVTTVLKKKPKEIIRWMVCQSAKGLSKGEANVHHIATHYSKSARNKKITEWFQRVFKDGGLDIKSHWANKLQLPGHPSRAHSIDYHEAVQDLLQKKLSSLDDWLTTMNKRGITIPKDVKEALIAEALEEGLFLLAEKLCDKKSDIYKLLLK